ncbi:hypothetical protein L0Y65_01560 [Candidatus Micrarchaeota archaeon]|nr:hypothetical protein [Candidatus Micrarchaeota archaeon]
MAKAVGKARSRDKVANLKDFAAFKKRKEAAKPENRTACRDECLDALSRFGTISPNLRTMLCLPSKLFRHGGAEDVSFSTEPDLGIDAFANSLLQSASTELTGRLPDFGIAMTSLGGTVFAVLVDSKRGLIVAESVRGMHDEAGSWDMFESALKRALGNSEALKSQGARFRFVLEGDRSEIIE